MGRLRQITNIARASVALATALALTSVGGFAQAANAGPAGSAVASRPSVALEPPINCGDSVQFQRVVRNGNTVTARLVVTGLDSQLPSWSDYGILRITWYKGTNPIGEAGPTYYPGRTTGGAYNLSYVSSAKVTIRVPISTEQDVYTVCDEQDVLA